MKTLPKKIYEGYAFPKDFFAKAGLRKRLLLELSRFDNNVQNGNREDIKIELNSFNFVCQQQLKGQNILLEVQLELFRILCAYALKYKSVETIENIINAIESPNLKGHLFGKYPYKSKLIYGYSLFYLSQLLIVSGKPYSKKVVELQLKSKYNFLKIYTHHIEGKNILSDSELGQCLTYLSGCLAQLSRWFEPLYYLNIAEKKKIQNPNIDYLYALNLDALKEKSCLNYNSILVLNIIDHCSGALKQKVLIKEQRESIMKIDESCRASLKESKHSITKLRKHKKKTLKSYKLYKGYKKFCFDNQLYLNEHSFFCNCGLSTTDNIEVETSHLHTKIEWVKQFGKLIDSTTFDFIYARSNLYKSVDNTALTGFYIGNIKRTGAREGFKRSLLKNSFKTCYSILDEISHGIFNALDINTESALLKRYKEKQKIPKLYFLNMWDHNLIEDYHFNENFYLISLYSIAKDLDRTDYSALKDFKKIRNSIEHKTLHIVDENVPYNASKGVIGKKELNDKTMLLLVITKSCILSFNNFIRRQSKIKESVLDIK